jgi:1-deoxy-D-xylulose-5-phosphate reductoisomerase
VKTPYMQAGKKRSIAILGSTGSIGRQALEVIASNFDIFEVSLLTANDNHTLLIEQALQFKPDAVVICNEAKYLIVKEALASYPIKVYAGALAVEQAVQSDDIEIVLTAMVGFAGLRSTIKAIECGKIIALANKETLVVAGDIISKLAIKHRASILPVDSEHSAIFQCLVGESQNPVEKIILTASGGPFRGYSKIELEKVTKAQALSHPNWNMGQKITIDSATMMNKGLEVIEAKWLFGLDADQIEVIIHPQSIVHSLVQFCDGSLKAQIGLPDMKLPIQYALGYPYRIKNEYQRFSFIDYPTLSFEKPDLIAFPNLGIAFDVMHKGGNSACVMNAANEIAVEAFLNDKISFSGISEVIEESLSHIKFIKDPSIEDYLQTDEETRKIARQFIKKPVLS